MVIGRVEGGGIVWASTNAILTEAVSAIGLDLECTFDISEVGREYQVRADGVYIGKRTGIKVSDYTTAWGRVSDRDPDVWDLLATDSQWTESDRLAFNRWMEK